MSAEHADHSPYFGEETTAELQRLARVLGGGWHYDQGIMPTISLTLPEAQALERRTIPEDDIALDSVWCGKGEASWMEVKVLDRRRDGRVVFTRLNHGEKPWGVREATCTPEQLRGAFEPRAEEES